MSILQDNNRDNLLSRKEGIEAARKEALAGIRDVLDAFAAKIGASNNDATGAMRGYADNMLDDLSYTVWSNLGAQLEELDFVIEREERA